jgi:hypothetical protein
VIAIDYTFKGKTSVSFISFQVLTNPSLILYRLQGRVVKDIKVKEGKGGAKRRVEKRRGGGKKGGKGKFEKRGNKGKERVIKVNKAR